MKTNRWELYSGHKDFKQADAEITATMQEIKNWIHSTPRSMSAQKVREEALRRIVVVLRKWANVGAEDSEPWYHCEKEIRKTLKEANCSY